MGENLVVIHEEGRRNGTSFYHVGDGYHFNFDVASADTIYFKCNISSCRGRGILRQNGLFERTQPHNHAPNILYTEVLSARRCIMEQSRSLVTFRSFSDIIATERRRIQNRDVRNQLTLRRLRPAMLRSRASIFPNIPQDLAGLSYILEDPTWQCLTKTVDLSDSLYLGSARGADHSNSIVFMSRRCLDIMRRALIIFADGTFVISPSIDGCNQVFTLVTIVEHTVIPLCWCLMERKTEAAYHAVLSLIRAHLGNWNFTRVVTDYEDAIINAFRITFNVDVQGCFFHSVNAMATHAKKTIGVPIITNSLVVKNLVRLCCCIPLLPQNLLQRGLDLIGLAAMDQDILLYLLVLRPFLEYIQYDWLFHANRGQTLSVCESEHRTNNASESNNRRMNRMFGVHHPNIFNFIRKVVEFEDIAVNEFHSLSSGYIPNRHRNVISISNDEHIKTITTRLLQNPDDEHIVEFLLSAAYTVDNIIHHVFGVAQQLLLYI